MNNDAVYAEWIEKRVRAKEKYDPKLRILKDRVNVIADELKVASDDSLHDLLEEQDAVIAELIERVSITRKYRT
jgi:predicted RNA methylase